MNERTEYLRKKATHPYCEQCKRPLSYYVEKETNKKYYVHPLETRHECNEDDGVIAEIQNRELFDVFQEKYHEQITKLYIKHLEFENKTLLKTHRNLSLLIAIQKAWEHTKKLFKRSTEHSRGVKR